MNPFRHFLEAIQQTLRGWVVDGSLPEGLPIDRITVEPPRDASHGDMACNAAMVLAKPARIKPRDLAEKLAAAIRDMADVTGVEVAGPGFLNMRLAPSYWHARIADILAAGERYGDSTLGGGHPVNVEYVSANPTGPMHIGHARGAVVGDALAALLAKAGYAVTKEYSINDAGAQVDVLAQSAFLRYREALGEDIGEIPAGLYPGDYMVPVGKALAETYGGSLLQQDEADWLPPVRQFSIDAMMDLIRSDLAALGVVPVSYTHLTLPTNA